MVDHWRCSGRTAVRLLLKWTLKICKKILVNLKSERTSHHKKSIRNQIDSMRLVWFRHENKRLTLVKFVGGLDADLAGWSEVSREWDLLMMKCEKSLDSVVEGPASLSESSVENVYYSLVSGFNEIELRLRNLHKKLGGSARNNHEVAGAIEKVSFDGDNGKMPSEQSGVTIPEQGGK